MRFIEERENVCRGKWRCKSRENVGLRRAAYWHGHHWITLHYPAFFHFTLALGLVLRLLSALIVPSLSPCSSDLRTRQADSQETWQITPLLILPLRFQFLTSYAYSVVQASGWDSHRGPWGILTDLVVVWANILVGGRSPPLLSLGLGPSAPKIPLSYQQMRPPI